MVSRQNIKKAALKLAENPERIILFGSYARGAADENSDLDFLVITEEAKRKNRVKLMSEMDRALCGLGFAKDVVVLAPSDYEIDK